MSGEYHSLRGSATSPSSTTTMPAEPTAGDRALKGVGDLIRLLPTAPVFLFEFLVPLLTDKGHCNNKFDKYLTTSLIAFCAFFCCVSFFTDSYKGRGGKMHYGLVTPKGLMPFADPEANAKDLSRYKLRVGDFAHAMLALLVFGVISLLDSNTIACFYPSLQSRQKTLLVAAPPVIGFLSGVVFVVFPNVRRGVGYPESQVLQTFE